MATTDMKWDFPDMKNPTIIDLSTTGAQDWWSFAPDEDVIFIGATTTRTASRLQTEGGHNIVVLGGDYAPSNAATATLYFTGVSGSVHVEGVHIDNKNAWGADGIAIYGASGAQPNITIQNALIENVQGTQNGAHGDVFQTHGAVGDIHIYNLTGSTNYQGLFIAPQYDPTHKSADLENVNIKWTDNSNNTYQYWFLDAASETPFPITLKNVYATERSGQTAEASSVWPKAGLGDGIGAVRVGNQITWPGLPYNGSITVGAPSSGDFTTADEVGIGFQPARTIGSVTLPDAPTAIDLPGLAAASGAIGTWIDSTTETVQINGTAGNDQLAGVAGKVDVALSGGGGDDTYIVDQSGDKVVEAAGSGTDTVVSYAASYTLSANVEHLTLGGTGNSNGTGNELSNRIVGNTGNNVLNGAAGNDMLTGGGGSDTFIVAKGQGNDAIMDFASGDSVTLQGFSFTSFSQVKAAMTENGSNVLLALGSGQTLTFAGHKIADFAASDFGFTGTTPTDPTPTDPTPTDPTPTDPTPTTPVPPVASGPAPISASPTSWFSATTASATLSGTSGNDQLAGLAGAVDTGGLIGGAGDDTYIVDQAGDKVVEAANGGNDTVLSYASAYTLSTNVEHLVLSGTANLNGTGNDLSNRITGNNGANILDGGAGNDLLTGGLGNDTFVVTKGQGNDTIADFIAGTGAGDVVKLNGFTLASFDQVKAAMTDSANGALLNLGNGQTLTLTGQKVADFAADDFGFTNAPTTPTPPTTPDPVAGKIVNGTSGNDNLLGSDGNDTIDGKAGRDIMAGGKGDDTYLVERSTDKVVEKAGEGIDLVKSSTSHTLSNNVENLTLTGTGSNDGMGNALDNAIVGNSGGNRLYGGSGNDVITGGGGKDILFGGDGADKFVYTQLADKGDVIRDFDPTEDSLDLRPLMTALGVTSTDPVADHIVNLIQSGLHVQVQVASGGTTTIMATIQNVMVDELHPNTDHWV